MRQVDKNQRYDNNREEDIVSQVWSQYGDLLHYIAKKILQDDAAAEDAVQEAMLRLWKNRKNKETNLSRNKKFCGYYM